MSRLVKKTVTEEIYEKPEPTITEEIEDLDDEDLDDADDGEGDDEEAADADAPSKRRSRR